MKILKISLLGLVLFAAPILFYIQAIQQEQAKDKEAETKRIADSTYRSLYSSYIRDSILLDILLKELPGETRLRIGKKLGEKILKGRSTSPQINIDEASNQADNSDNSSAPIPSQPVMTSKYDSTFYDDKRYGFDTQEFSNGKKEIPFSLKELKTYSLVCVHIGVDNQTQSGKTLYFTFPNQKDIGLEAFYCINYRHVDGKGKKVPTNQIHTVFHKSEYTKEPTNETEKTVALYIPIPKNPQSLTIDLKLKPNGELHVDVDRKLILNFQ